MAFGHFLEWTAVKKEFDLALSLQCFTLCQTNSLWITIHLRVCTFIFTPAHTTIRVFTRQLIFFPVFRLPGRWFVLTLLDVLTAKGYHALQPDDTPLQPLASEPHWKCIGTRQFLFVFSRSLLFPEVSHVTLLRQKAQIPSLNSLPASISSPLCHNSC